MLRCTEVKDAKPATTSNKSDTLDHHQHNGNVRTTLSLQVIEENTSGSSWEKLPDGDVGNNVSIDVETKTNDAEVVRSEPNAVQVAWEEANKEPDEYQHSLWKWPSGRSWLTKVNSMIHTIIVECGEEI